MGARSRASEDSSADGESPTRPISACTAAISSVAAVLTSAVLVEPSDKGAIRCRSSFGCVSDRAGSAVRDCAGSVRLYGLGRTASVSALRSARRRALRRSMYQVRAAPISSERTATMIPANSAVCELAEGVGEAGAALGAVANARTSDLKLTESRVQLTACAGA